MRGTYWHVCAHSDPLQAALCPTWTTHAHTRRHCGLGQYYGLWKKHYEVRSASLPRAQACVPRLPDTAHARHLLARMRSIGSTPSCSAPHLDHPRTHAPPLWTGPVLGAMGALCGSQASRAPKPACPDCPTWQTHARHLLAIMRSLGSTPSCFAPTQGHPLTHAPPLWSGH
jgi:hypothetical protein